MDDLNLPQCLFSPFPWLQAILGMRLDRDGNTKKKVHACVSDCEFRKNVEKYVRRFYGARAKTDASEYCVWRFVIDWRHWQARRFCTVLFFETILSGRLRWSHPVSFLYLLYGRCRYETFFDTQEKAGHYESIFNINNNSNNNKGKKGMYECWYRSDWTRCKLLLVLYISKTLWLKMVPCGAVGATIIKASQNVNIKS